MKRRIGLAIMVVVLVAVSIPLSSWERCEDVACSENEWLLMELLLPAIVFASFLVGVILAVSLIVDRYRNRRGGASE